MPLSISFYRQNQHGASSFQSVAVHDRAYVKPSLALPCEFYHNIWGPTPEEHAALRRKSKTRHSVASTTARKYKKRVATGPLVDIAQVAHVVTTMSDFRADYGASAKSVHSVNIWDDCSLVTLPSNRSTDRGPSTADTEPENLMSPISSRADQMTELSCELTDEEGLTGLQLPRAKSPEIVFPARSSKSDKLLQFSNLPVPPPSSQNGSVVFSAVFAAQHEWSWSAKFLLGIHEPVRHALFVMDRFLEQSQRQAKPHAEATRALETHVAEFFLWFKTYFVEYLLCQHEVKTSVLLPLLNIAVSTKQQLLDVYHDIKQMLAQIQQLERALCVSGACSASSWLLRLQVLQTEIRQLNRAVHSALNSEEAMLQSAMSAAFTERAFRTHIMPRIFRAIRAKRVVVPWIVERSKIWGGEDEHHSLQGMLPFSAKFMYRKIWRPYFMTNVAVAMTNLNDFVNATESNNSTSAPTCHGEMCAIM